jgi:hypothetical protein
MQSLPGMQATSLPTLIPAMSMPNLLPTSSSVPKPKSGSSALLQSMLEKSIKARQGTKDDSDIEKIIGGVHQAKVTPTPISSAEQYLLR